MLFTNISRFSLRTLRTLAKRARDIVLKAFSSRPLPAVVRDHRDHGGNLILFAMIERKINHGKLLAPCGAACTSLITRVIPFFSMVSLKFISRPAGFPANRR